MAPGVLRCFAAATMATCAVRAPCQKSGNLHVMKLDGPGNETTEVIALFGGKGVDWKETRRRKHKVKKKVAFFSGPLLYNVGDNEWARPDLVQEGTELAPQGRWKSESATFNDAHELAVFGGCTTTETEGVLNDLWVFSGGCCPTVGGWRKISQSNPPTPRRGHLVAATDTHLIVIGGKTSEVMPDGSHGPGECITDVWATPLDGLSGPDPITWTQRASFPAPCRWGSTGDVMVRPDGSQVVALFGGRHLTPGFVLHSTAGNAYQYFGDLWFYDPVADTWTQAHPEGTVPVNQDHQGATVANGELYIFGGRIQEEQTETADLGELWSYSIATNSWTRHADGPCPRFMPSMTSAQVGNEEAVFIIGGEHLPGSTKRTSLNDVWMFTPSTGGWTMKQDSDCSLEAMLGIEEGVVVATWLETPEAAATVAGLLFVALAALGLSRVKRGRSEGADFHALD